MPSYDEKGFYRDEQGNIAPDPRSGDMAPGASQAIANFLGTSYTPGSRIPPAYMGAEEMQHWDSALPHDPTALATGRSGGGTFMPRSIQIGGGAPKPALGIQAGTLEEDIDQEAGGMGEVLANIPEFAQASAQGQGDPMDESDNISPLAGVTPPRKPAAPTQSGPIATGTIDQRSLPGTGGGNTNTMPIPGANMKNIGATGWNDLWESVMELFTPDNAAKIAGVASPVPGANIIADAISGSIDQRGVPVDPSKPPVPPVPMPERVAGPNTVPDTGDDAGDLRGERRPMNEAEYMENVVQGGDQQTTRPAPGAGSVRPTVPVNESPLIGADSPMLKQLMQMKLQSVPPSMNAATGPVGAAGSEAATDALMKRYMGAVGG